jgi:hypothetical protein
MNNGNPISFDLAKLPAGCTTNSVKVQESSKFGRPSLHVTLDEKAAHGLPDVDFVDMPTFLILPVEFESGEIAVDLLGSLRSDAPDYARAFAGLAYRIDDRASSFEAVYLRPLNGRILEPPLPRAHRAVQYFAYPEWRYQRLRDEYPDGRYESGADIKPDEWINLVLTITKNQVTASVNGGPVLTIDETKASHTKGRIGLFVDIGTDAYFSNLVVTPSN